MPFFLLNSSAVLLRFSQMWLVWGPLDWTWPSSTRWTWALLLILSIWLCAFLATYKRWFFLSPHLGYYLDYRIKTFTPMTFLPAAWNVFSFTGDNSASSPCPPFHQTSLYSSSSLGHGYPFCWKAKWQVISLFRLSSWGYKTQWEFYYKTELT